MKSWVIFSSKTSISNKNSYKHTFLNKKEEKAYK